MLDILPTIVEGVVANILAYAVLLAAIATIAMALLELLKAVSRVRLLYHRWMIKRWSEQAYPELLLLTVTEVDSAGALFDQPTDKMMGQVQSAANVALDFPEIYPTLYAFLTRTPASVAARRETGVGESSGKAEDAQVWRQYSRTLDNDRRSDESLPEGAQAAMRARARLDHFVTRKLDAFQTRTEYIWARSNQLVATIGCGVLIYYVLDASRLELTPTQFFFLIVFGAMLAPFAKDVVTALTGLRARAV
jgi:hypothetical protein